MGATATAWDDDQTDAATTTSPGSLLNLARHAHWKQVGQALAAGASVGAVDSAGWSLLHFSCVAVGSPAQPDLEAVRLVLAHGGNPNAQDCWGKTPVWAAAYDGTPEVLEALLDAGGDVNATRSGVPPLVVLAGYGLGDVRPRLALMLAHPALDLQATYQGKRAEEWARDRGRHDVAVLIAAEVRPAPARRQSQPECQWCVHGT